MAPTFAERLIAAGGETGRLIASHGWAASSLGPIEGWPGCLRTVTELLLRSPVPLVLLWGEEGVMLYNDAYSVFAGGRHPQLLGSEVREGWPEVAEFNDHVMRVGLAGGTLTYKDQELTLYRHGRAERVWMNLDYSPVLDESGRPAGVLAIVVETTGRVAAEREIKESSERFRAFLTASTGSTYRMGPDWSEMRQLDGQGFLSDTTVPSTGWLETYIHPDDRVQVMAAIREAIRTESTFELEHRVRLADGGLGWIHSRAVPILDERGEIVEWFGAASDVTDKRRAAERLRESEERQRFLLELGDRTRHLVDSEAVVAAATQALGERLRAARVAYVEIEEAQDRATILGDWTDGVAAHLPPELRLSDFGGPLIDHLRAGRTLRVHDTATDPRTSGMLAALDAIGVRAIVSVPLLKDGQFVVNLNVHGSAPRSWTDAEVELIEAIAERTWEAVERARAEAALRGSEARLRELNETLEAQVAARTAERDRIWRLTRDLMCVARVDGTLLSVNPAWERLLGWPAASLVGRNAAEIKHPDDRSRTAAELARLAEGHSTLGFEDRYRHRDGTWRWISWMIEPEGELIYCVGRDVTAEREARAALEAAEAARREADALYRAYFKNTPEALFLIGVEADGGFVVEQVNPAHEAGIGLRLDDIRGRRIEEVLPPEVAQRVLGTYRHVIETGATYQYREVFDLGSGPQHWDTSLVPVRDGKGRISRLIGSSRNVTRQVMAEEALRQAQKMEAVGQLTGGIAHDFNNLLGAVVGSLDLIRRKPGDIEKVRRFAEAGLAAAERGAKLTGQLLAFSRAQRLELKPVVVAELVQGMRDLLSRTLGPMVRLTFTLDGDGAVLSDPTQLEMAVLNLAINARDAMVEGGELAIATAPRRMGRDAELAAGEYVELSVADTGSGMPPEVAARALDPFFTTKEVGKGTGLGLSQVYGVARQAGGTVRIESRPGTGTTVRIYLPRTSSPVQVSNGAEALAAKEAGSAATVLVVDDDPDIRRVLVASLEALGYRVLEAMDGSSGLAAIEEVVPDLIVLDFAMPGMNGAEVARVLRERRPDLPIVFASGYADTAAIEAAAGKDATVLRKPFRVDDLQAVLSEALNGAFKRNPRSAAG